MSGLPILIVFVFSTSRATLGALVVADFQMLEVRKVGKLLAGNAHRRAGLSQGGDELVGLTATPERQDGKSLLPDFGGHVAAELRLWSALDRQLLSPFDYYGISDGVDLRKVRWSRTGYRSALAGQAR